MEAISDIEQNVRIFGRPFAYAVLNKKAKAHCSYCLRPPKNGKLFSCAKCQWSRYCNRDCQRGAWKDHHSKECARLALAYPNLPLTEVLYFSRILDRLKFIQEHGDKAGWQEERKFQDLMSHKEEIAEDARRVERFEVIYAKLQSFRQDDGCQMSQEELFLTYCQALINSHSLHDSSGTEIGMALDLGISKFDHSCRPNCAMTFDGFITTLRPLMPGVNTRNPKQAFISYIDVGQSKYQRQKQLKEKWYFVCRCPRCLDPADDRLTSIKCPNDVMCDHAVIITEVCDIHGHVCPACNTEISPLLVKEAQVLMNQIFEKANLETPVATMKGLLSKAERILHQENVYYCRLLTAYSHASSGIDASVANPVVQKAVYNNFKKCFPAADRHLGYQLLHLVRCLIERGERSEAVGYAYEAMSIFEICFGFDHPYYLQSLALWTFLDTKADKTDEELIALLNFSYNKPVNLSNVLSVTT